MAGDDQLPHILIREGVSTEAYRYPGGGGATRPPPARDRATHAKHLHKQLDSARTQAERRSEEIASWAVPAKKGLHLEFESEPGFDLELQSLDQRGLGGIRLVAVRSSPETEDALLATVFVPEGKLGQLESKIRKYATEQTKSGQPRHRRLVEKIAQIRLAQLRSFWTDNDELLPSGGDVIWWEVWLRDSDDEILSSFREVAGALEIRVDERDLTFPSTRVVLAQGSLEQFSRSIEAIDSIAELRRAKTVPSLFMERPREQLARLAEDLLRRTTAPREDAPSICILDTGVTQGHPLIRVVMDEADLHAVDEQWQTNDHNGHGTGMAGLSAYYDLAAALAGASPVEPPAVLESVKILPPPPDSNHPELYGSLTKQAVSRVEIERPDRNRTHLMAVTATDGRERGKPSSWSAAVDQMACGGASEPKRLFVLAAGNSNPEAWVNHPVHLETEEVHDPGQAWNALTVGAFTERINITEGDFDGWEPVSVHGGLSPSTTTSATWQPSWPLKPDLVLEGGNAARSPGGDIDRPDSLSLLTTHYRPAERLFTTFGDTSAASALIAHMAASLQAAYPGYWPETIRALLVHSASWTDAMRATYGPLENKKDHERLIRRCGFGVPDMRRALWSARNRLTLISQQSFQPYVRTGSSTTLKELQLYELPWPVQELRDLEETEVELRVTLSYFIEPNPSERGHRYRHRYSSHGFRFDVRGSAETFEDFQKRLNKVARQEGERSPRTGDSSGWLVGSDTRHRGSIHADIWRGTAADLAERRHVAVFPVSGWWKERHNLGRWQQTARYALVMSIHAPEVEVDLYTPVSVAVSVPIET